MKNCAFSRFLILLITQSPIGALRADQVVTLTSDPWPPYVLGVTGGEATGGIGVELMQRIFDRIDGVDVKFPLVPWKRALQAVEKGTMDGIGILLKTPERERYMEYTDVLFTSHDLVWYTTRRFPHGFSWNRFEDLKPHMVGVVRGHSYGEEIDKLIKSGDITVSDVSSADQLFIQLARGRFDLAFANDAVGHALAKEYVKVSKIVAAEKAASKDVHHIGFSKKSSAREFIPRINEVIKELKGEGVIERIIRND